MTFLARTSIALLLALPWLNPFSQGPSTSIMPLLVSWTCAATLVLATRQRGMPPSVPGWAGIATIATLGGTAAACAWAGVAGASADALALAGGLLVILACTLWAMNASPDEAGAIAVAWLVAGLLSAAMGGLQYLGAADSLVPWVSAAQPGEAFGNLRQRNLFASLTSIALCALLWLARTDRRFNRPALTAALATGLAAGNALSHSRTGFVELLLILGLAWTWGLHREHAVRWALGAAAAAYLLTSKGLPLLLSASASPGVFTRLAEGAPLCSSRMTLWSNVLELIRQKPLFGWGWGQLDHAHFVTLYDGPRFCDILDNAHNLPLHLAVELGVPAALLACGAGLWAAWRARPWREADPLKQMAWGVLAIIVLHSLLEYPLWYGPFQIAAGMALGLLIRPMGQPTSLQVTGSSGSAFAFPRLSALLILAGVAVAAWDYQRVRQIYLQPDQRSSAYRDNTLAKVREAWLFRDQARFAELTITPLQRENAEWTFATAQALLHFSPEPRVIEKVIESAVMLGKDDEAMLHLVRYKAAFPKEHALWAENLKLPAGAREPGD